VHLRPYQQAAKEAVFDQWQSVDRTLLVLPTGTGKTIVFSNIARDVVAKGGRVLILAHRGELLSQAADKLRAATGLACAVEKAEETAHNALERVTVGSVQSMMSQKRLDRYDTAHYSHIIIDEAHHCISESYQRAAGHFAGAKVLGVTATADRADKKNLGQYFESLAYEYSLGQAVAEGFLAPIRIQAMPIQVDITGIPKGQREPSANDCATALDPYIPQLAAGFAEHGHDRKGLIFVPLCVTGQKVQQSLNAAGLRAYYCSGEDRSQIAAWEADGPGSVMVNAMLLTEGYDHPPVDLIAVWRFTKSRAFYSQMVGRGTRIHPGKDHLLVLDNLYLGDNLELCRPAHVVAEDAEIAKALTDMAEEQAAAGVEIEVTSDESMDEARRRVVAEREKALAEKLEKMRHRKHKLVDPLQWAVSVNAEDLVDYQPAFGWEMGPPSKKQLKQLEDAGIFPDEVTCAGMASKLVEKLQMRRSAGFATPKQVRCLERFGFKKVGSMPFESANKLITRIAANGWRVPEDIKPGKEGSL
jgi:superfamily II DNA or RNA helicase